jgi:exosortase/archaeosortase family protein
MNAVRRPHLAVRLGAFVVIAAAAIDVFFAQRDATRTWESRIVATLLRSIGVGQVQGSFKSYVLVAPKPGELFAGNVTSVCSSALPLMVLAIALLGVVPGRVVHRIQRFAVAALIVFAFNIARLAVVMLVGAKAGMGAMAPVHEWVGSFITLAGWSVTLFALFVLVGKQRNRIASTHTLNSHLIAWRSLVRLVRRRNGWAKTSRVAEHHGNVPVDPVETGAPIG